MEKGTIKTISIEDFKLANAKIDYVSDDFMVASCMENLPYKTDSVRLNFFLILMCIDGRLQLDINGKTHVLQANELLLCLPTMIMSNVMFSMGHKVRMIGFSTRFLQCTVKKEKDTEKVISYIYKNPIHTPGDDRDIRFRYYMDLVMFKINETPHRYRNEILQFLFSAVFHEMLAEMHSYAEKCENMEAGMKQSGYLFKRFIGEVSKDGGQHRSVAYYADILCYSSKYISSVVKQETGRTALDWINQYAIERIKYELKHSDKCIKEISEYFNFPNQSFFGKYVKAHLGMSPAKYRNTTEG